MWQWDDDLDAASALGSAADEIEPEDFDVFNEDEQNFEDYGWDLGAAALGPRGGGGSSSGPYDFPDEGGQPKPSGGPAGSPAASNASSRRRSRFWWRSHWWWFQEVEIGACSAPTELCGRH